MPGPTITVQGEGGAISELDVPDDGTVARELFDDHLAKGRYVVVSGNWPPAESEGEAFLPGPADKVGDWRAYAESVDPDNADAIAKMTKAALIEQYAPAESEGEADDEAEDADEAPAKGGEG